MATAELTAATDKPFALRAEGIADALSDVEVTFGQRVKLGQVLSRDELLVLARASLNATMPA